MNKVYVLLLFLSSYAAFGQQYALEGKVIFTEGQPKEKVEAFLQETNQFATLSPSGTFRFDSLSPQQYNLTLFASGYQSVQKVVEIKDSDVQLELILTPLQGKIGTITIVEEKENEYGITRLKPVEGTAIYAGKKARWFR